MEFLLIASDHGMTDSGNHGGSSYEETDSLALFVSAQKFSNAEIREEVNQVDIAPTLALLFGVPIPKNNVGTVMAQLFTTLKAEQQLKALQLNSYQLLRLLQTHFTESRCRRFSCKSGSGKSDGAESFCCSYLHVTALHESWISKNSRVDNGEEYITILMAYKDFLETASKWLSSRSTDKPIGLLALGIAAMLLSCLGLMVLLFLFSRDINFKGSQHVSHTDIRTLSWDLDESLIVAIIFILILSMGSSSMVEEEHYIWHFMTSSFYLVLLRKTKQSITRGKQKVRITPSICTVISVLICGRILRGWHQGGVNWCYLPDISKLLVQAGNVYIQSMHVLSVVLVIIICSAALLASRLIKKISMFLMLIYLFPSLMIFEQILKYQFTSSVGNTTNIQIIYTLIGTCTVGILVAVPWLMPLWHFITAKDAINFSNDALEESQYELLLSGFRDSVYVIGWCYVFSWCLLQMLLQQSMNSMPMSLLLVQILASICLFSTGGICLKQWVKVGALYYVGMAGHFSLGNTNTLATIDVAGAFNLMFLNFHGISSHSTVLSGILMFIITYASPMLALLSMLMDVSMMDANSRDSDFGHVLKMTLGYPCLVPLALNSIVLVAYTIVFLLMRNHLFVWSVFSPKYLYVCVTTVCVYIGVSVVAFTATYTYMVFAARRRLSRRK